MLIGGFRLGFASNSSSSHSVIYKAGLRDEDLQDYFGWQPFTAASTEAKMRYLIASETGMIDHQSRPTLPRDWLRQGLLDSEFSHYFAGWLAQPDVAILGGNDNSGPHPLAETEQTFTLPFADLCYPEHWVCRRDGDWWTFFNRRSGARIRFSLEREPLPWNPKDPMLLDVKITDQCAKGCSYCYQDSRPDGKHVDLEYLQRLAQWCYDKRVFEVVLGGGEPTSHPQLKKIVQAFAVRGVSVGITTGRWEKLYCVEGAHWALSVRTVEEAKRVPRDVVAQVILGAYPVEQTVAMVHSVPGDGKVLLLGYKECGRADKTPHPYPAWNQVARWRFSLDTLAARHYLKDLMEHNFDERSFAITEGPDSAYVDAVRQTIAPDSYSGGEARQFLQGRGYDDHPGFGGSPREGGA